MNKIYYSTLFTVTARPVSPVSWLHPRNIPTYLPNPCERYNFRARSIKNKIHAGDIAALQGYGIIIFNAGRARSFRVEVMQPSPGHQRWPSPRRGGQQTAASFVGFSRLAGD